MTEPTAASPLRVESPRSWPAYSVLIALLLATFVLLWPTVSTLIEEWEDTNNLTYTHGYLIALVSAWLLWRARPLAADVPVTPEPRVLVVIAALSFVWLLSYRAGIEIAHQLLLPVLGWGVVYAAFGWHVARRCASPGSRRVPGLQNVLVSAETASTPKRSSAGSGVSPP